MDPGDNERDGLFQLVGTGGPAKNYSVMRRAVS
jgi:hypothetical protein